MSSATSVDPLDVLGVGAGVFLVLVGIGSLSGAPWQYSGDVLVAVGEVAGALGAILLGAALAWFVYSTQ